MPSDRDEQEVTRLQQLNDELNSSLKRCRRLLHDYEVRLTANSNQPVPAAKKQQSGGA